MIQISRAEWDDEKTGRFAEHNWAWGGPVCTLPQFLQTTFPVRRLDQMLKAWHESQISSGSGEFDLRVDGLNFALNSTIHTSLGSPPETQVLGGSVSKLHHPHSTQSHCCLQKRALRNVSQAVCPQKPRENEEEVVTGLQSNIPSAHFLPGYTWLTWFPFRILAWHLTGHSGTCKRLAQVYSCNQTSM